MKNVVLTEKQQECVNFPTERDLLVTGVAGSGKSLVVVSRAVKMSKLARENGVRLKIGIFAYANALIDYTKEILEFSGKESSEDIYVTTLDKEILQLYRKFFSTRGNFSKHLYSQKLHMDQLNELVSRLPQQTETTRQRILSQERREWLMQELCWMKQHMFSDVEQYQECVRKGRGKIPLRREDRPFVFEIYKKYFFALARAGIKTIDMVCEDLYKIRNDIPEESLFDVILIDEAQDLALNKLLIARTLAKKSVTIAADFAQKIYTTGFTWREIGLDIKGRGSQKLKGTHRNTKQIALLATSLQRHNTEEYEDGDITPLEVPDREGPLPRLIYSDSIYQQEVDVIEHIKRIQADSPNSTIGIFGRDAVCLDQIKVWLTTANIPFETFVKNGDFKVLSPGIKLITYHSAKGLEFDQVLLPLLHNGNFPYTKDKKGKSDESFEDKMNNARNLLYVGMTRARQMLYMFTTDGLGAESSPLLEELDTSMMKVVRP